MEEKKGQMPTATEVEAPETAAPEAVAPEAPHTEEVMDMETLLAQEGLGMDDLPQQGDIRKGIITSILPHGILVDVKAKSDGLITGNEFDDILEEDKEKLQVGDEISVYVINAEDSHGNVVLSYTRAKKAQDWETMEDLLKSGDTVTTVVEGLNKGGLLVPIGNLRGFVPGSLISVFREKPGTTPEERWGHLVGEEITLKVMEVERGRRRLVLSERDAIGETREAIKDKLLEELKVGDVVSGYVSSVAKFGAFVNIQGIDGLIHISQLSWDHIDHPSQVIKKGDKVDVKIINIDKEARRIGLSLRALQKDPWLDEMQGITEGQLVQATITNLTSFGAFAKLANTEQEGLIHISELSSQRIGHPKEVVSSGDSLTLRVIKINKNKHQIGLSLSKVDDPKYASLDLQMLQAEIEAEKADEESETSPAEETSPESEASPEVEETPIAEEDAPAEEEESPAEEEDAPAEEEESPAEEEDAPTEEEESPEDEDPPDETEN